EKWYHLQEPLTEMINGTVYSMSEGTPKHSRALESLRLLLSNYLKGKDSQAYTSELEITIDEKNRFRPDISVISGEPESGVPSLVIEITEPKTVGFDTGRKFMAYQKRGIKEYWIASPESESIEQFVLKNGILILKAIYAKTDPQATFKSAVFEDLEVNVPEIFSHDQG
ncbi:MAG: Uma2 family endonuclease, partial [Clostridiales bacterium]|nr:Uma2 family endonuclease [Clostridiales bacterium]